MRRVAPALALLVTACAPTTGEHTAPRPEVSPLAEAQRAPLVITIDAGPAPDAFAPDAVEAAVDAGPAPLAPDETLTVLSRQLAVYFEPHVEPEWNGSLRAGARVRVLRGPLGHEQCGSFEGRPGTGWYQIEHDGYVCVSRGAVLTRHLRRVLRGPLPTQPRRENAMPYTYAMASRDAVLYRRLPTEADEHNVEPDRFIEGWEPREPIERIPTSLEALEGFEDSPVLRRVTRGMVFSLDRAQTSETQSRFWRTHSGGFVRSDEIHFVGAPALRGVSLTGPVHLPLRFTTARTPLFVRDPRGRLRSARTLPRWSAVPLAEGPSFTEGRDEYVPVEGGWIRRRDARDITAHTPPDDLAPREKWVDVNLDHQFVVAYEGATAVYATLMSSGIGARDGGDNYETIQGAFRIEQKHLTTTMDGNSASGAYSIEDVPWVMYFRGSFALHGAFWHDDFGRVRSHGCVNLAPADARWIFLWSAPALPEGWHSVTAVANDPGTRVYVHYDRQRLGEEGGPGVVPGH